MLEPTRRQFLAGGIGAVALGALAACGGSDSSSSGSSGVSTTSTKTYTLGELEDNAQKEGGTLVYYTLGQDIADAQIKGFTAKYPWAKISTRIDNGRRTLTKIVQEFQAKAPTADVFVNTSGTMPLNVRKQLAALTKVPNDAQTPGAYRDLSGYGHAYYQNLQALAYNTNLVTTPLPTDIVDLGDSSFRGKIAMDNPQNAAPGYFFLSSQRKKWGDQKWNDWLKSMKANEIFLTQSATSAYQAVVSGERAIAPDNADDVLSQKAGTPVKLAFYEGVPTQIFYMYTNVRAKRPYTANLFINWSLSEEGQQAIAKTGRSPIVKIDTPLSVDKILPAGITVATEEATNDLVNNQSTYMDAYNSLWPV